MIKNNTCIKKLNNYLNYWLKKNDLDCKVCYGSDFSYDSMNEIIYYSFLVVEDHNKLFLDFCKKIQPEIISCDNFILSFFHELGHYVTEDDFTETLWESYIKLQERLNKKKCTDKDYIKYYKHPVEYEATKWACNYIVEHAEEVEKLYKQVLKYEVAYLKELGYDMQEL